MSNTAAIQVDNLEYALIGLDIPYELEHINSVVHQYSYEGQRKVAMSIPLGIRCNRDEIYLAGEVIARVINYIAKSHVSEENPIKGFLGNKLNGMEIARTKPSDPDMVVVCYITLTQEAELILKEDFDMFDPGNHMVTLTLKEAYDLLKNQS